MAREFEGRTALVTGASKNMGRAIALSFAERGGNVGIVVKSSREEAEKVAEEARAFGVKAAVATGDIGVYADCERMVGEVGGTLGPIDTLVNNAALRPREAFMDITVEKWNTIISSNLSSVFYLSRLVLPGMAERGFGRIISIGGPDGVRGMALRAHNVTAKSGLIGLTKAMAVEFGDKGVTANVVVPGVMNTVHDNKEDYPEIHRIIAALPEYHKRSEIAVPRPGESQEVADAVMFFASEKAGYMTSQTLYVAGGLFGLP